MRNAGFAEMIDFTRPGTATYVGADGSIQNAAADVPRFDYTNGRRQLLLEGPATNICAASEGYTASRWAAANFDNESTVVLSNGIKGFLSTGFPLVAVYDDTSSGWITFQRDRPAPENGRGRLTFTTPPGCTDARFYMLRAEGGGPYLYYRVPVSPDMTYTASWFDDGSAVGGLQIETGNYASSYIPTNGGSVTRPADSAKLSDTVTSMMQQETVSGLIQFDSVSQTQSGRLIGGVSYLPLISLHTGGDVRLDQNVTLANVGSIPTPKCGVAFSIDRGHGTIAGACNAQETVVRAGEALRVDLSQVYLGRDEITSGDRFANGWYDQFLIWPFRMTDEDLQRLAVPYA